MLREEAAGGGLLMERRRDLAPAGRECVWFLSLLL